MFKTLRRKVVANPRALKLLLPAWIWLQHKRWSARNFVTSNRPVSYQAGDRTLQLKPEGQIAEVMWAKDFDVNERDFIQAYLRQGMQVVNAGANIGFYTILASSLVGPTGAVHAFEPSTETFIRFMNNLALNGCQNCSPNKLGLSSKHDSLVLRVDPENPLLDGHRFVAAMDTISELLSTDEVIETVTLDSYLSWRGVDSIDLLIVDIEGAELQMLTGSSVLLTKGNPTILLECTANLTEVQNLLMALGYAFWTWNKDERKLQPCNFQEVGLSNNVIVRRGPWQG